MMCENSDHQKKLYYESYESRSAVSQVIHYREVITVINYNIIIIIKTFKSFVASN